MPLTLSQLRTPITQAQALEEILETLESLGFNVTAWQSGSVQRTLLEGVGAVWSQLSLVADSLSRLAFNETSEGEALTAFSLSHYANTRVASVATRGTVRLTGAAVGPPHAVSVGDLVVTNAAGTPTFRNATAGTIPAGGTLDLTFECETPGTVGNVANNTLTILRTPLAGVTVTNPANPTTWITTVGTDEETDPALRARNTSKWGTVSPSDPRDRYVHFVRTASPNAARVEIDDGNPDGPGTLRAYIATSTGVAAASDVTLAQAELDRVRNPTAAAAAFAAVAQPQQFIATVFITAALNTVATQAAVEQALRDYVNGIPIGGEVFPGSPIGIFVHSEAAGAMTDIAGVRRVQLTTPPANVDINAHQVMTVQSIAFTYTSV